jgi:hypothetical protein
MPLRKVALMGSLLALAFVVTLDGAPVTEAMSLALWGAALLAGSASLNGRARNAERTAVETSREFATRGIDPASA